MKQHDKSNQKEGQLPNGFEEFLKSSKPTYTKSKDDVWAEIDSKINFEKEPALKSLVLHKAFYWAAAVVLLMLVSTLTLKFYETTVYSATAQSLLVDLPDGSKVTLNAETTVSYHPFWWRFNREVSMTGEAFFEVEKGSAFTVKSSRGNTQVLGTSFNIYARGSNYKVTCVTGKVKVASNLSNDTRVLKPKEMAEIKQSGTIAVKANIDVRESTSWTLNEHFINGSLSDVVEEIERQYGVQIKMDPDIEGLNVNLSSPKENRVEPILERICPINGLTYKKTGTNEYLIIKQQH